MSFGALQLLLSPMNLDRKIHKRIINKHTFLFFCAPAITTHPHVSMSKLHSWNRFRVGWCRPGCVLSTTPNQCLQNVFWALQNWYACSLVKRWTFPQCIITIGATNETTGVTKLQLAQLVVHAHFSNFSFNVCLMFFHAGNCIIYSHLSHTKIIHEHGTLSTNDGVKLNFSYHIFSSAQKKNNYYVQINTRTFAIYTKRTYYMNKKEFREMDR